MNEKVKNLITQRKALLNASQKQIRDNHLISLGLVDESKPEREYVDSHYTGNIGKYDSETNRCYIEKHPALEVSDAEYEEICKYFPPTQKAKGISVMGTTLKIIAIVFFAITFFVSISSVIKVLDTKFYVEFTVHKLTSISTFICSLLLCMVLFALGVIVERMEKGESNLKVAPDTNKGIVK